MNNIKNKFLVMSGKGGVGKTTIAVNLAYALSQKNFRIGLLDVDIHGPNVPKMVGLEDQQIFIENKKMVPVNVKDNLKVMSIAFLSKKESAVIWRGPIKHKLIQQFIEDVDWGELDYLIVDLPPGTGDEVISISQLLKNITGSIIVSTPQQVSLLDAIKAVDCSKKVKSPIIGIIENMAGDIFGKGSVKKLADEKNIEFLGSIKLNKQIAESGKQGKSFVETKGTKSAENFNKIINKIIKK